MRLFLIFAFVLFCAIPPLSAQGNGIDQDSELVVVGSNKFLRWYGHDARTYFVQVSDPNDHLNTWTWAPIIESGNDEFISYEVDGTADKGFFRLTYTDQVLGENETLETADFDNDGIPNWEEIAFHLTNPLNADTDGDGMTDGWEVLYFLSPTSILDRLLDLDDDGLSNIAEFQGCTSPIDSDSDDDGVSDGDEVAQGTDPCAAASFTIQWHRVTRRLEYDFDEYPPPNNKGTLNKTAEWDAALNTNEMLTAAIPFPDLKSRLEMIAFPATPPAAGGTNGLAPSTGHSTLLPNPPCFHATMSHQRLWLRRVQAETTAFQQRAFIVTTRTIDGVAEPKTFESKDIIIPANNTTSAFVDLNKGFTQNFTGNVYHYETFTGRLCPLELRQTNMPNIGVPENSTDLDGARGERMIGVGGNAYVTGEPAVPQLLAKFRDMPAAVSIEWRLEVRSERTERGTLDDRDYPALNQAGQPQWVTLAGDAEWDITAAMASEFVGGNCTLFYRLDGANDGSVTFRLRGKNPLDAAARAHIDVSVGASFTAYAYGMPRSESRFGPRVYNQFNAGITNGTPFYGAPDGWGVCQIDRRSNRAIPGTSNPIQYYPVTHPGLTNNQITTTPEVWNWHTNVVSMNAKLVEKQAVYNRFIDYFRQDYGQQPNWSEPPAAHTIGNTTLPAEAWGVIVLYNGALGVNASFTPSTAQSHPDGFSSPWSFNPNNGVWTFDDNFQNYATARVRPELDTSTIPTQE